MTFREKLSNVILIYQKPSKLLGLLYLEWPYHLTDQVCFQSK